ncbi:MAG: conjugal transfer protein TraG [Bacteroidetes bacterium 43-16]|uniref:TraG family conjugative transposon ATPase n=1 Tax=uncultured Dysgonomonas sp. TaxID=206096 RepID=UPI000928546B|nr:TraG family conjugative transposon ATPase [uncultured Dysgonomonas sp.]OJV51056.1 MAG: conjugal transfer protein TraG [Bacteroidetes bacterium 43-16]
MEKWLKDLFPIMDVEHDCILSKQGDITVAYQVALKEIFTMSNEEYEAFHQTWIKAIKMLPNHSVLHKQDWFVDSKYEADFSKEDLSFLSASSERFFNERPFLDHKCYLFLTKKANGRKPGSSIFSNLIRPQLVPTQALNVNQQQDFLDICGQFKQIMEDSGFVKMERITADSIWSSNQKIGLLEQYCYLNPEQKTKIVRDIEIGDRLHIGGKHCQLYTLGAAEDLPTMCGSRINYDKYSTDRTKFSIGFAATLGQLLSCNHIYNQYVFVEDAHETIKKLESKRLRLQSLSAYSRENAISRDATNAFLNEAIADQRLPVKAHFNVLVWTENTEELKDLKNKVSSALAQMDASAKEETVGAPQIFWSGIPGNAADFPLNDCLDTFAEQAACFFNLETGYRTSLSPVGIRLGDRLTGKPVHVDLDQEPKEQGIIANFNAFILSGSGGGKSYFTNHVVRSYYEQGTHVVVVDIGHSYELLCELVGGYYFTYEESNPIKFNPFYIPEGDYLDTEKKESIKTLLLSLWKKENETYNRSDYVALSQALTLYFDKLEKDTTIFPCFNSFYEFLKNDFREVMKNEGVKEKEFDLDNFLYVLKPYFKGGEFDYLLNAEENLDLLHQKFIVFELDNIKNHAILLPTVTLIIAELFVSKMRKLKGIRKMIVIEEAWKAIAREGMAEYIKYLYKTARKFLAKTVTVTQEIEDIIGSEIIKEAIINNSDCKVLLDQSKYVNKFDAIQDILGITDKQKAEILSINKSPEPGRKYKENWICLGTDHSKVYRLETSLEEYLIYTSEQREKVQVKEYIKRYGNIHKGVAALAAELRADQLRSGRATGDINQK